MFRSDRAVGRAIAILAPVYVVTVGVTMVGYVAASEAGGSGGPGSVPGYVTAQDWLSRAFSVPLSPLYIAVAYPLLLLVVLGLWAGRRGLLDGPGRHRALLTRIATVGIAGSLLGALPAALVTIEVIAPDARSTAALLALQVLTGVLGGAGYAALFALLSVRLDERRGPITRAVAAVGQRSLTCYLFNSVVIAAVLHRDLLGVGERVDSTGALAVAFAVWLAAVLIAAWMDRAGRQGPMDALLRRLVYRNAPGRAGRQART